MVFIEKMKNMKIYKQPCFLPTVEGNKKKDSAIILLTPSYDSSKRLMNNPLFINKKRFESYFLDRDVSYYIGNKQLKEISEEFLYLEETKRSNLKDSEFGIPEDRKFPLDTEDHVRSAIKLFGHAEESKKKTLAKKISRRASKYGIKIPETTQCYKYLHEGSIYDDIDVADNIIFDLGSVLVQEVPQEKVYEKYPDIPKELIDHMRLLVEDMWRSGNFENATFDEEVEHLLTVANEEEAPYIEKIYKEFILGVKPFDYTEDLVNNLMNRDNTSVYYLSNWNQASFEMLLNETHTFDFLKNMSGGVVSYQTGTGKPDPKFYQILLDKYHLEPSTCIFFDDKIENIETARNLNIEGVLFDEEYRNNVQSYFANLPVNEAYEFESPKEDDNVYVIQSSPLTDIMDIKFEMDDKEKRWNSIVLVKGVAPKTLRGRSECIVIKDDMIYIDPTDNGICCQGGAASIKYDVPGGGWDPNEPHDICAIRETNEEAMIDVKDVQYVDNYLTVDKVRPDGCYCDGLYSKVYVGKYNGKYTGPIADVDRADIAVSGNFYPIKEIFHKLNPIHQKAIVQYTGNHDLYSVDSIEEATQVNTNTLYHLSQYDLDGRTISPTVPKNYLTKNGYEDKDMKRVCFSTSIDGCLMGLSQNLTGKEYYVYTPDDISKYDVMRPDVEEVPDSKITKEHWICSPVTMKMIGKIRVIDSTRDPIPYTYGEYTAELYPWNWEWIEKKHENVFITEDSLQKSELDSNFKKKSISDINYEVIDFHSSKAKKYIETDSYLSNLYHKNQLKDFNGEIIVDKDNGTVIGRVFIGTGKDKGYIGALRVYDKYKGYGFGDILIKDAINKYGGYDLNVFKDNEVALKMYKKYGFEVSDEDSSDSSYYMKLKSRMNEAYIEDSYLKNDVYVEELFNSKKYNKSQIHKYADSCREAIKDYVSKTDYLTIVSSNKESITTTKKGYLRISIAKFDMNSFINRTHEIKKTPKRIEQEIKKNIEKILKGKQEFKPFKLDISYGARKHGYDTVYFDLIYKESILNEESYIEESYLKNDKDILYNKEAFDRGDINLCFITGHSGSGKSTMGQEMESNNIEHSNLDNLQTVADNYTIEELKNYGDLFYNYFKGPGKKFYITYDELVEKGWSNADYEDKLFPGFVHFAMKYAATHKDKKFVVEGIWLYGRSWDGNKPGKQWFTPDEFKDYAFYIKGTSLLVSKFRAAKRDSKEEWVNGTTKELKGLNRFKSFNKLFFLQNWKYYILDEKSISRFRKYFEKQEKTIKENYIEKKEVSNKDKITLEFNCSPIDTDIVGEVSLFKNLVNNLKEGAEFVLET